jgi:hypothetical protein
VLSVFRCRQTGVSCFAVRLSHRRPLLAPPTLPPVHRSHTQLPFRPGVHHAPDRPNNPAAPHGATRSGPQGCEELTLPSCYSCHQVESAVVESAVFSSCKVASLILVPFDQKLYCNCRYWLNDVRRGSAHTKRTQQCHNVCCWWWWWWWWWL